MTTKYHQPDTTTSAYGRPQVASTAPQPAANVETSPAVSAEVGDISSRPVSGVESLSRLDEDPKAVPAAQHVATPDTDADKRQATAAAQAPPSASTNIASAIAPNPNPTTSAHTTNNNTTPNKTHTTATTSPNTQKTAPPAAAAKPAAKPSAATAAATAATTSGPSAPHQPPKRPGHKPQKPAKNGGLMAKFCFCFGSSEPEYDTQTQSRPEATASASSSTAYESKTMQQPSRQSNAAATEASKKSSGSGAALAGAVAAGTAAAAGSTHVSAPSAATGQPIEPYQKLATAPVLHSQEADSKDVDNSSAYELSDVVPASASEFSSDPRYFAPSQGWLLNPVSDQLSGRKCLVLDLDETLVHSSFKYIHQADFVIPVEIEGQYHNVYVIKRPGVDEFMKRVGELYEVVVFTASVSKYGDPLLDQLDIHNVVHHRLFRESCYNHQGNYIKNLSQLGRPLKDVIIIDNSPASYIFHPQHAIPVSSWFSDAHDNELLDMLDFLEDMAKPKVEDVSLVLDVNM